MNSFSLLIDKRIEYLKQLPFIGEDWITGVMAGAKPPSSEVCELAISFLIKINTIYQEYNLKMAVDDNSIENVFPPKLIMGPIPNGGVSIEIYDNKQTCFLSIFNDNSIEAELIKTIPEQEENTDFSNINDLLLALKNNLYTDNIQNITTPPNIQKINKI
jgi:hypothetical protein